MPIKLDYTTPATGADASYHVVSIATLNYDGGYTFATVSSYVSKEAKDAGKQSLYQQQIQITGIPDGNPRDFCEAQLIQPMPTDGTASSPVRYTFAGGVIVDSATVSASDTATSTSGTSSASNTQEST